MLMGRRPGFARTLRVVLGVTLGALALVWVEHGFRVHEVLVPRHGIDAGGMAVIAAAVVLGGSAGYGWLWLRLALQRMRDGSRYAVLRFIALTDDGIFIGTTAVELPDQRPRWEVRGKSTVWLVALAVGMFASRLLAGTLALVLFLPDPAPTVYRMLAALLASALAYHFAPLPFVGYERRLKLVCGTGLAVGFLVPLIVSIVGIFTS